MKLNVAASALLCLAVAGTASAQSELKALVGKQLPAFSLKDLSGKTLTQKSVLGKVVLLDFWASWCGPCKAASPTMQKLHSTYSAKGLMVIGANTSESDEDAKGAAAKYAKEHKYTYAFTPQSDKLANALHVTGLPTFIAVDRRGKIRQVWLGYDPKKTPTELESFVSKLIAEK